MIKKTLPRIIFVEGLAGAGKTSFIKALKQARPEITVVNEYASDEDDQNNKGLRTFIKHTDEKLQILKKINDTQPIVVDRGPLSLLVNAYVETLHRINNSYEDALEWYYKAKESGQLVEPDQYIYITAPTNLIFERARKNGWYRQSLGWLADPETAMERYELLFNELYPNTPIVHLDGARPSEELVRDYLA